MTDDPGRLLQFLGPGYFHYMGNALFTVQGHAQTLAAGKGESLEQDLALCRENILDACRDAQEATELLRYLIGGPELVEVTQPLPLLQRLEALLRVCLRGRGLTLRLDVECAKEQPRVAARTLVTAVLEGICGLVQGLPTGLACEIRMGLLAPSSRHALVRLGVVQDPGDLPFGVDLAAVMEDVPGRLCSFDVEIGVVSGRQSLELRLPTMVESVLEPGEKA